MKQVDYQTMIDNIKSDCDRGGLVTKQGKPATFDHFSESGLIDSILNYDTTPSYEDSFETGLKYSTGQVHSVPFEWTDK